MQYWSRCECPSSELLGASLRPALRSWLSTPMQQSPSSVGRRPPGSSSWTCSGYFSFSQAQAHRAELAGPQQSCKSCPKPPAHSGKSSSHSLGYKPEKHQATARGWHPALPSPQTEAGSSPLPPSSAICVPCPHSRAGMSLRPLQQTLGSSAPNAVYPRRSRTPNSLGGTMLT